MSTLSNYIDFLNESDSLLNEFIPLQPGEEEPVIGKLKRHSIANANILKRKGVRLGRQVGGIGRNIGRDVRKANRRFDLNVHEIIP